MLRMLSASALKDCLPKFLPELQICVMQLTREGSPTPELRLPQAKLSRNSNQIARGRIRRFESDMPSQAVVSNSGGCRLGPELARAGLANFFWDDRLLAPGGLDH